MSFAQKLKRLTSDRHKNKLSLRAGLHATAICDYVSKGSEPSASNALKIAKVLDVDLEWLVDDLSEWPPVRRDRRTAETTRAA